MTDVLNNKNTKQLFLAIVSLRDETEAKKFLRDLLTEAELQEFGSRWLAARMLDDNIPYSAICKKTGLSTTTVARISKWLKKGTGGYRLMLDRLATHHHNSSLPGKGLS